eukprot:1157858-Pelagomonas_calceolata.AAC.5
MGGRSVRAGGSPPTKCLEQEHMHEEPAYPPSNANAPRVCLLACMRKDKNMTCRKDKKPQRTISDADSSSYAYAMKKISLYAPENRWVTRSCASSSVRGAKMNMRSGLMTLYTSMLRALHAEPTTF